jgi:hypothetical protein
MTKEIKHYYAGYGMNTDPEQMKMRTGAPVPIGRGLVRDHAFRFNRHADVYPHRGTDTHVVLWEINDQALRALDLREGYPTYYDRKIVEVECGGLSYQAWMYFMTDCRGLYPPSDSYYGMLDRGYTVFGVPKTQIVNALSDSIVDLAKATNYVDI